MQTLHDDVSLLQAHEANGTLRDILNRLDGQSCCGAIYDGGTGGTVQLGVRYSNRGGQSMIDDRGSVLVVLKKVDTPSISTIIRLSLDISSIPKPFAFRKTL